MTNLMNQKVGGSKAASPAKCGAQSSKNKKVAAQVAVLRIRSSEWFVPLLMRGASLGSVLRICVMRWDIKNRQTL